MTTRPNQIHSRLTPITPAEERLPYWTRSTNPIVRRHLGLYWRTLPPELQPILLISAGWAGIIALCALFPTVANYTLITVLVSLLVIPFALVGYGHILFTIALNTAQAMQEEQKNNTLNLLMATPMSVEQILLGKVASALWRRMDDWVLVNYAVALTMPPLAFVTSTAVWDVVAYPWVLPVAVMGHVVVALVRLMVEPLMVGMIGVYIGSTTPSRNTALSLSVALSLAYFGLLWLAGRITSVHGVVSDRLVIPPNYTLVLLIDYILPITLPLLISYGLLKLTVRQLTKD